MNHLWSLIAELTEEGCAVVFTYDDRHDMYELRISWHAGVRQVMSDMVPKEDWGKVPLDQRCAYWRQLYHQHKLAKGCTNDTIPS